MANTTYPKARQAMLSGQINLTTADVKIILVDLADYAYGAAHEFLSDVPSAARVATTAAVGSKTVTGGVFDHADTTFGPTTGDPSEALIWYVDTGTAGTSRLVHYQDTGIANMPVTPNGGAIDLALNPNGVFSI